MKTWLVTLAADPAGKRRTGRRRLVPLVVPVTLLRHHFRRNPNPYISRQVYLNPHPRELMLRNVL